MRAILFRKLVIDGVNYYQLYGEREDFEKTEEFSSFANYENRTTNDYFYIDGDSNMELEEPSFLNIYTDSDDGLKPINDSNKFMEIFDKFKEHFHIIVHEIKTVDEIVNEVKKKVLFQDEAVINLVEQIYLNQSIIASDLPTELKLKLKNNILFHGPFGSGKKSIIQILEKNLGIPYADIKITGELKDNLEDIITQLIANSENDEEASCGLVFIRDNFQHLAEIFDENAYSVPSFFTSQNIIAYGEHKIDFRTLTFVVLYDERIDLGDTLIDTNSIQNMTDCPCSISTRRLSDREKYSILLSENGRIRHYEKFLNQYDKKMFVDEKSLRRIIRACASIDPGMNILNSVIDAIMKTTLIDGIGDVRIDKRCADMFLPAIALFHDKEDEKKTVVTKTKEDVFDDNLKKVYELVTNCVVGQDKQVKTILYTILENRRMANKKDLEEPKKYIKNILIRGESGSGKTLIVETIAKALKIPAFIADSTQYTEEGYVGASVTDMLVNLYHLAGDNQEEAEKGILFIDELDKKANNDGGSSGPSRSSVLDGLLKIIEGAVIPINVGTRIQEEIIMFDTSRLTVICSGAFEGIEKYRDDRLGKRKVGFTNNVDKNVDKNITDEDYIAYGMNKQFMARLPLMVELNKNTVESLVRIMKESSLSPLKIEKYILEDRGIEVEYTESFYHELAKCALRMKVGARGISKSLERVLSNIHIEDISSSLVSKIIFDGEVVENPNKIIFIPREKQNQKIIK